MKNLATTYRPMDFNEVIEQDAIKNILQNQLKNNDITNAYLFCGPSGDGKALPLNADILSVNGYIKMKDVHVGDILIDGLGEECKVLGVYPQGVKPIYKITFSDNTTTLCSIDHLWKVNYLMKTLNDYEKASGVFTTHELKERLNEKFYIPVPCINCFNKEVPINATLMGWLIMYVTETDEGFIVNKTPQDYILRLLKKYGAYISNNEIKFENDSLLEELLLNIIDIKCIHPCYLYSSAETRKTLLIALSNTKEFTTNNKQLKDDFVFLARSLGYLTEETQIENVYTIKYYNANKYIVNIEYVKDDKCQCIYVDSPDHTFITNDFIVTHNTTTARIFANKLDAEIIEIDAASNSGVDNIRDLIQQVNLQSMTNEYKVVILDEAHSLTSNAWQALLKTLEEPPTNVIFIFATTDPQKIPKTILSRVQRFNFKRISNNGIAYRLHQVIEEENKNGANIQYKNDALNFIAKLADGHMRDALTILNKCLAFDNKVTIKRVIYTMNLVDYDVLINMTLNFINKDKNNNLVLLNTIYNNGVDLKDFINNYIDFLINVNKYKITKNLDILNLPLTNEIKEFLNKDLDTLFILNKLLEVQSDIKASVNPKSIIEAIMITI